MTPGGPWLSPDCRDENHHKCDGVAWNDAADEPTQCQCGNCGCDGTDTADV